MAVTEKQIPRALRVVLTRNSLVAVGADLPLEDLERSTRRSADQLPHATLIVDSEREGKNRGVILL